MEIPLSDGDFLDAEYWETPDSNQLSIITHGLEGNSGASYVRILTSILLEKGHSVLAWNFRGCSGRMNRKQRLYHSGAYEDLGEVIQWCHQLNHNARIHLFGFSLGGNLSLVAGARLGYTFFQQHNVVSLTAISPPLDLAGSALKLEKWWNKGYSWNFLKDLKNKIRQKAQQFPYDINLENLEKSKTIISFDDHFTAPLHGFKSAADYYQKCSSLLMLEEISLPTRIVLAQNDPMISRGFFRHLKIENQKIAFDIFPLGGHCGFWGKEIVWAKI